MDPILTLIVDATLATLMVVVIAVCYVVYRRLGTIKEGQAELKGLVDNLNTAVVEAQRSVANLKAAAGEVEAKLQVETRRASTMADELSMITEAGNNLADRIEQGLTSVKEKAPSKKPDIPGKGQKPGSKQQQEILAALREAR